MIRDMKGFRLVITLLLTFVMVVSIGISSVSAAVVTPSIQGKAGVLVDVTTGQVVADKNGSQRLPIASLSKLITVYLVEQKISAGELSLDQNVTVPADIAAFSEDTSVANEPMSTSQTYTVKELLEAALLPSSNAAAVMLAYLVSGDQVSFYHKMEKQLNRWGIKNVTIYSASGLANGDMGSFSQERYRADQENTLSAREIAIVAQHLVEDYPSIISITSMTTAQFPSVAGGYDTLTNTDTLLSENTGHTFMGLKTGTTVANGGNFVGLTTVQGRQVLTVVLNSGDSSTGDEQRLTDTVDLLNQVEERVKVVTKKDTGKTVTVPLADGDHFTTKLAMKKDLTVFVAKETTDSAVKVKTVKITSNLKRPIKSHTVVATGKLVVNKTTDDYLAQEPTTSLKVISDIHRRPLVKTISSQISDFFKQLF